MDHTRAVRPPTGVRPSLFRDTRRQNPTSVRLDTASAFKYPNQGELVERAPGGEYTLYAPQAIYKHMALGLGSGKDSDEETGMWKHSGAWIAVILANLAD